MAKESDFATNLKTGPYRQSSLADAFRRAMTDPGAVAFSDFGRYPPSDDAPAAFAARAVVKDGKAIGVFAVQIPAEPLNELMHFTAGMGESGETYLVGPDGLMRSQSRFTTKPTVLEVKVDNHSVKDGQSGMSGKYVVADYRGIPVLSVFAPVDFGGQPFVLLAEIEEAEVLRSRAAGSCSRRRRSPRSWPRWRRCFSMRSSSLPAAKPPQTPRSSSTGRSPRGSGPCRSSCAHRPPPLALAKGLDHRPHTGERAEPHRVFGVAAVPTASPRPSAACR